MVQGNKNGSKNSRGSTADKEFNDASGAQKPDATTPRLNKQAVLASVKKALPPQTAGGAVMSRDGINLEPTPNQKDLMQTIDDMDVTLIEGTFGTGKTMWACYKALESLVNKKSRVIAITAPAVTAGEEIGFLKGGLEDKMLPFVNQILEAFDDFIGKELRVQMQECGLISIEPHAYLRGRSMNNTFFILDESQNASGKNLQTALTRLGYNSKFVFMGDNGQNDRTTGNSAYTAFIACYTKPVYANFIGHARLGAADVKRHPLLKLIVENGDDAPLPGYEQHKEPRMAQNHTAQRPAAQQPGPRAPQ